MLQCLIGGRAFAPSHSALAKELGYKGKMGVYRLMGGTVRPDTVDKTWRLIMERYRLTEEFLCGMARTFFGAGLFYTTLAAQMTRSHPRWAETLVLSLTAALYDHCSPQFRAETAPVLKDLMTDEPNVYWGIVALVYIRAKGIDVYKGKGGPQGAAAQIIDALDRLLYGAYPEKAGAHEAASNLKALRQRGYIQTGSDPQDDRKKQIRLTEKAHCLKHRIQEAISQKQGCLCQGLSSHQIEILEYCLTKMLLNIKQYSRKE